MRKAVSVTLDTDNLLWLRAQAASQKGNLSRVLDNIVKEARQAAQPDADGSRSVKGTIGPLPDDPELDRGTGEIRAMFAEALAHPLYARERPLPGRRTRASRRRA